MSLFGFSVFLGDGAIDAAYIREMAAAGFGGVFTSLHIPEDDAGRYRDYLYELGALTKELGLDLTVDISGDALRRAGFSFDDLGVLKEIGVTRLRADFHISNKQIAEASHEIGMCLNASTITSADIAELREFGADFSKLIAWHNYYPRPETGLGRKDFALKNIFLHDAGFTVVAFTPGDARLRGPLYQGLPTLEKHRYHHPLAGALELLETSDEVYVGDGGLSERTRAQFAEYLNFGVLLLFAERYSNLFDYVAAHEHVNRHDAARDVIRSAEARFWEIPDIPPALVSGKRRRGDITVDNNDYGRYRGDIQIVKRSLPEDRRVNIVGRVRRADRDLLPFVTGGVRFEICEECA